MRREITIGTGRALAGVFVFALVLVADARADYSAWAYRMNITFSGYGQSETLTNFPALVIFSTNITNFSYTDFESDTGGDLRFVDSSDGSELNYEVEKWNTNGSSYVWMRVPLLTNNASIWAYWGNPEQVTPPAYTTNGLTWSEDFACVHHLVQTNSTSVSDSSSNKYTATLQGNAALTNSIIANGVLLDGNGDYIQLPRGNLANAGDLIRKWKDAGGNYTNSAATLSMWVKLVNATPPVSTHSGFACLDQVSPASWPSAVHYPWTDDSQAYITTFRVERVNNIVLSASIDRTNWHLVTVTSDGTSGWKFYQNGTVIRNEAQGTFGLDAYQGFTVGATINAGGGTSYYLDGGVDEVRLHRSACSSNWIWAAWMNVASNSFFGVCDEVIAQVVYVDTNAVAGANNGTSWADAYLLLTNALTQSPTSVIWVAKGTHTPGSAATDSFNLVSNRVYGGFAGTELALRQRDFSNNVTILNGVSNRRKIVQKVSAGAARLDGFTIQNANGSTAGDDGGGVYWTNGTLTLANCTFTNNYAADQGGAVYVGNDLGTSLIINCSFFNNHAGYGGAIFGGTNALSISNCVFRSNYSSSEGGAIYMIGKTGATNLFTSCTFTNSYITSDDRNGGALYIIAGHNAFFDCNFLVSSNRSYGGAMYLSNLTENIVISNCIFRNNYGQDGSSAIYDLGTGSIHVVGSEFSTVLGGGSDGSCIYGPYSDGKTNVFRNCSFTGNKTLNDGKNGGALYIRGGWVEFYDCGFTNNNSRQYGGGAYLSSLCRDLIVSNCTFLDNRGEDSASAIYHAGTGGITVIDSVFSTTNGGGGHGQGIYGPDATGKTNLFRNCSFTGHDSTSQDGQKGAALYLRGGQYEFYTCGFTNNMNRDNGGAIYLTSAGDLIVSNCTFKNNKAEDVSADICHGGAGSVQVIDSAFSTTNSSNSRGGSIYAPGSDGKTNIIKNSSFTGYRTTGNDQYGGALRVDDGHLQILGCTFMSNTCADHGGAVYVPSAVDSVIISNCDFIANTATAVGDAYGGAVNLDVAATVYNCVFAKNQNNYGAIRFANGGTVMNCTFYSNSATANGGAIYLSGGTLNITNCIFWQSTAVSGKEIFRNGGTLNIGYLDIDTNFIFGAYNNGGGIINTDPMFGDAANNDFHLKSKYGRWRQGGWIQLPSDGFSPCIDAGHPNTPFDLEPSPNGGTNNMGRYGNTSQASRSAYSGLIVVNTGVSNVTAVAATLYGEVVSSNGVNSVVRIYWGDEDCGTNAVAWDTNELVSADFTIGSFSTNISVSADKAYYYRCRATNAVGSDWADETTTFITGEVKIQATDSSAAETASDTASFHVWRPVTCTGAVSVVAYTVGGIAVNGADYSTLSGSVTIPADATNATIVLTPVDDVIIEGADPETFSITLAAGAYLVGSPSNATATITDNDTLESGPYKLKIQFTGYNRTEPLTNFPALVVLGANITNFSYSTFQSVTGGDLRFANSNDTQQLYYEIEEWNAGGSSYVWVQVPIISSSNDYIWAYWGNASQTNPPAYTTNGSTWSNGYQGVWHLTATNGAGNLPDSTSYGRTGTNLESVAVAGRIAGGRNFDGDNDRIYVGGIGIVGAAPRTLYGWAKSDKTSYTAWTDVFGIQASNGGDADRRYFDVHVDAGNNYCLHVYGNDFNFRTVDTNWHFFAATYDSGNIRLYLDGFMSNAAEPGPTASALVTETTHRFAMGERLNNGNNFDGLLDEIRISDACRSSNWIWACWFNMASNGLFSTYTVEASAGSVFFFQ